MEDRVISITEEELRKLMTDTVHETLTLIGIKHEDPVEMQRDFTHLRDWRIAVEGAKKKSFWGIIGVLTSGLIGLLWMGLQGFLHK